MKIIQLAGHTDQNEFSLVAPLTTCTEFSYTVTIFKHGLLWFWKDQLEDITWYQLDYHLRTLNFASVRTTSLTPTGVSINLVLGYILDDHFKTDTEVLDFIDAKGRKCVVFIEVVGFVADYPACSSVLYLLSYTSNSPCTNDKFGTLEVSYCETESRYADSFYIHSANASFARGLLKKSVIRS